MIMCDKIIDAKSYNKETKAIPKNFNKKNSICKRKKFCILLAFLLITIAFMIAVSIYSCLIKCKSRQKHLLPYCTTNDISKKFYVNNIL